MGTFLYFAFGSNLLKERLRIENPSAVFKGIAILQGYKFHFSWTNQETSSEEATWKGCAANITADPSSHVWGSLWELKDEDRPSLDRQEWGYNPITVTVCDDKGSTYTCLTYQMKGEPTGETLPSPQYKDIILRGAKQSMLPPEYIKFIEAFPDNKNTTPVDIYNHLVKLLT